MANAIRVSTDTAALSRKLDQQVKRYPRYVAAGINKAAAGAFTLAVREIQKDTGATAQKSIRRNMSLTTATQAKPEARLFAFSSKKDRIPIFQLKPKPRTVTKRRPAGGVRYGPDTKLIPGSFIARMKSGHVGVFKRVGPRLTAVADQQDISVIDGVIQHIGRRQRPRGRTLSQQIAELYGPSVALVFSRKKITGKILAFLDQKVPEEIRRAFKYVTG